MGQKQAKKRSIVTYYMYINVLGRSVGNVEIQEMTRNGYVLGVVANFPQSQKCGGGMHQSNDASLVIHHYINRPRIVA